MQQSPPPQLQTDTPDQRSCLSCRFKKALKIYIVATVQEQLLGPAQQPLRLPTALQLDPPRVPPVPQGPPQVPQGLPPAPQGVPLAPPEAAGPAHQRDLGRIVCIAPTVLPLAIVTAPQVRLLRLNQCSFGMALTIQCAIAI